MKKFRFLLIMPAFLLVPGIENSYGLSVKPVTIPGSSEVPGHLKAREFVRLSIKQFIALTGKNIYWWGRLKFKLAKAKIRYDLKRKPDLRLTDYYSSQKKTSAFRILYGIVIGAIVLLIILYFALGSQK